MCPKLAPPENAPASLKMRVGVHVCVRACARKHIYTHEMVLFVNIHITHFSPCHLCYLFSYLSGWYRMVRDTVSFVAYTELLKLGRKAAMTHYAMQPDDAPPRSFSSQRPGARHFVGVRKSRTSLSPLPLFLYSSQLQ